MGLKTMDIAMGTAAHRRRRHHVRPAVLNPRPLEPWTMSHIVQTTSLVVGAS